MDRSFRALKNLDAGKVRAGARQFAKNAGLTNRETALLVEAINVRTAADFKEAIAIAVAHLKAKVRGRPYALLVESRSRGGGGGGGVKSSEWLAFQVVKVLGPPTGIVLYDINSDKLGYKSTSGPSNTWANRTSDRKGLFAAVLDGAKCVVHLNDAIYSGTQLATLIDRYDRDAYIQMDGGPFNRGPPLFIAAGFGTAYAKAKHEGLANVYFAKTIASRPDVVNIVAPNMRDSHFYRNLNPARLLTILPHKVPNSVSFGMYTNKKLPQGGFRSYFLTDYVKKALGVSYDNATQLEPYKRVNVQLGNGNLRAFARTAPRRSSRVLVQRKLRVVAAPTKKKK